MVLELADASSYQQIWGVRTNLSDHNWHYVVAVWDGVNVQLYADGVTDGALTSQTKTPLSNVYNLLLGAGYGRADFFLYGSIDEARVFSSVLSAAWILTEYNNQNSPATFSACDVEIPPVISGFLQTSVSTNTSIVSLVDKDFLVSKIQTASGGDTYFDSTSKLGSTIVYYVHQDDRQEKKIFHLFPNFSGLVSWSSFARDGTWEKFKVKAYDQDGAIYLLDRSSIGTGEDLVKSDGTVTLNLI
jgi:hypothetical protein